MADALLRTPGPTLQRTAVVFFIFNRPLLARRVFEAIRAAHPPRLFVIADGPRRDRPDEARLCQEARALIDLIDWPCEVLTRFSNENLGCRASIVSGLDWVFSQAEQAIILEDDCLPDSNFFPFCAEMLELYRDDERVHMVRGCNLLFGRRFGRSSYHFSRFSNVWGWATWARAWKHYDIEMRRWPELRDSGWLERYLPTPAMAWMARSYFESTYTGRIDDWEYPWVFAGWTRNAVAVAPATNLITNLGFGPDATKTRNADEPLAQLVTSPLQFPLRHPPVVEVLEKADAYEWAMLNPALSWRGLRHRVRRLLGRPMLSESPYVLPFLSKLRRHWRAGTLLDALRLRSPLMPDASRVMWHGRQEPVQAARQLAHRACSLLADKPDGHWVLSLGDGDAFHTQLNRWLKLEEVPFRTHRLEEFAGGSVTSVEGLAGILAAYPDARRRTRAARLLARHPVLAAVPFEYPLGLDPEAEVFERLDEYPDTFFVSPVLLDDPSPYTIYQESLRHFRQKCGLRDFLDLYQLIKWVVDNRIPGDIAEFGSYEGHSGWLIAKTLDALRSDKRLFLFDTFEEFPEESLGMDLFWNRGHRVTFDNVRAKFHDFDRIRLVKGDFTQTLRDSGLGAVALAHVDCDSNRATRFLFDTLLPERLSPRGVLVCEDYGHPALLGARAAVHESLDGKNGVFQFFSQFSGLYVVLKL